MVLLHDGDLFIIEMDAVRGERAALEEPCFLHIGKRTLTVLLLDLRNLRARLVHVDMHFRAELLRRARDLLQEIRRTGVGRVRAEHDGDAAVRRAVIVLVERDILLDFLLAVRRYADDTAREDAAHARLRDDIRDALHERPVHIRKRRRARLDHLDRGQRRAPVDIVRDHLRLDRPDMVVEPLHELHIIRVAAQERHRRVRMSIDEARHCKHILPIYDLIGCKAFVPSTAMDACAVVPSGRTTAASLMSVFISFPPCCHRQENAAEEVSPQHFLIGKVVRNRVLSDSFRNR